MNHIPFWKSKQKSDISEVCLLIGGNQKSVFERLTRASFGVLFRPESMK